MRGRQDDNEDIIRHRLNVYNEQTAPLLEYYAGSGKMLNINGDADIETVYSRIDDCISVWYLHQGTNNNYDMFFGL